MALLTCQRTYADTIKESNTNKYTLSLNFGYSP